jgi:dihydroxyacetone kinase-like predicted kinase
MEIQIISTSVETKPTAKGSYQQLEVVFKNLSYQGKVESKKLMSFGANAAAFKTLSSAQSGQTFEVTVTKNAQGYNDWTSVTASAGVAPAAAAAKSTPAPKSTYETPEERAQRQVLIVKQSSLSAAVSTLSVGAKAVKPDDVIALAQKYTDWVFGVESAGNAGGATGFDDLPDFIPEVN